MISSKSTLMQRICQNIRICSDGCWYWMGSLDHYGYGTLGASISKGKKTLKAHRLSYEMFVGSIPQGLHLDHLCSNKRCVNPEHLEPVTHSGNMQRMAMRRTRCKNGHPWVNTLRITKASGKVEQWCRECNKTRCAKQLAKRKARALA